MAQKVAQYRNLVVRWIANGLYMLQLNCIQIHSICVFNIFWNKCPSFVLLSPPFSKAQPPQFLSCRLIFSLAPGSDLNIHNSLLMSMLNGCQNDLATWQNWIVFDTSKLEPEQGGEKEGSHRLKGDTDPSRGFFSGCYVLTNQNPGAEPLEL